MKKHNIININSIFVKLLIVFLIIITPICLLWIAIYNWGINIVKDDILNSMKSQVNFFLKTFEMDIRRIKILQLNCLSDYDINNLSTISRSMSDIEKMEAILRLQQRLVAIKNSSSYISNVCVYIPSIHRNVYAKGSIGDFEINEFNALKTVIPTSESQIVNRNNNLYIITYPIQPINGYIDPSFIISIELDKSQIINALEEAEKFNNSKSILISLNQNYTINVGPENAEIENAIYNQLQNTKNDVNNTFYFNGEEYLLINMTSDYLDLIFLNYVAENQIIKLTDKYMVWFWIFLAVAIFVIIMFSASIFKLVMKPLDIFRDAFLQIAQGDLNIEIKHKRSDEFKFLYNQFNETVGKLRILIDQVYKQKILTQRADLKQLQSQINPHFLYNSFFILHHRIKGGEYGNALLFSKQLGDYFKFITRSASNEVALANEVEHARIYADIQAMRFCNRIKLEFDDLPAQYRDILVPRLILQPIIENAFEHGLENKMENGILKIGFQENCGYLIISVEDNGDNLSDGAIESILKTLENEEEINEITALFNVHKRLKIRFGKHSGVSVSRGALDGLRVNISISLQEET